MFSSPAETIKIERRRAPWSYSDLLKREAEIVSHLESDESAPPVILLSEVSPVITVGPKTGAKDFLYSKDRYTKAGIETIETGRGGKATYHGPGQWVLFVIDRMERLTGDSKGVRRAVRGLLTIAEEVGRHYRNEVHTIETGDEVGAWSEKGKFAALGIRIGRGVLQHGIAINGFATPQSFFGIKPCGLAKPVDFLLKEKDESAFLKLGDQILQATLTTGPFAQSWKSKGIHIPIARP